jgi:dynein heavy chain
VNDCSTVRIELHKTYGVPEWREDLRTLYKSLGIDNKKIIFSFSDKEIRDEVFVEDINSILNVGELTSLFAPEDTDEINYEVSQ